MNSYRRGLRNGVLVNPKLFILDKVNLAPPTIGWSTWSNWVKLGQTCLKLVLFCAGHYTRRSIERAHKLGAKPYDSSGDLEAALLWLDKVNKIYKVMGCTNYQRVLFSSFMMKDRAKDWWDAVDRTYPDGMSWD